MSLRHMQIAVSIAELKSFTKAAEKLGVSQPSLSKSVSLLESELGAELFDRKNGLSLTYAGEIYISKAKNLLRLNDELNNELHNLSKLKTGKLTIGMTPVTFKFIEKSLGIFCTRFSNANIKIIETHSEPEMFDMLDENRLDVAFSLHFKTMKNDKFLYENIADKRLFLAAPKAHPLVSKLLLDSNQKYPKTTLSEFKNEKFVLSDQSIRIQTGFENIFKSAGFSPDIFCMTDSIQTSNSIVSMGLGVGFSFEDFIDDKNRDFIALLDIIDEKLLDISLTCIYKKFSKLASELIKITKNI